VSNYAATNPRRPLNRIYKEIKGQKGVKMPLEGRAVLEINHWGSMDGAALRVIASHQCRPGLILARCHMTWAEFVVGSHLNLLQGFFSRLYCFPPSTKTNTLNSNLSRIEVPHEHQLRLMWLPL